MKIRETATIIKIQHRFHGYFAPSVIVYGKYEEARKHVEKTNTLLLRFPEHWMCY